MTDTHTTADIHQEKVFEAHIVACLTSDLGYIERHCPSHYDIPYALDTELLFRFLRTTQPESWQVLEDHYSAQAEGEVLKRLERALRRSSIHSTSGTARISAVRTSCASSGSTAKSWMTTCST